MHCREICIKYGVKNLSPKEVGRYESGQKRCTSCEVYINWDGNHCPCCGHFLRTKPRNSHGRNILAHKIIFKKFQLKLKLNKETIDYSQKLFNELNEKNKALENIKTELERKEKEHKKTIQNKNQMSTSLEEKLQQEKQKLEQEKNKQQELLNIKEEEIHRVQNELGELNKTVEENAATYFEKSKKAKKKLVNHRDLRKKGAGELKRSN